VAHHLSIQVIQINPMKRVIILLLLFINFKVRSQHKVEGEYLFSRHEMIAGFNFSVDGKFQFFYSYGAVDRTATGNFSIRGDTLKLKSNKEPGKDFTITAQNRQATGYTVTFDDPNNYLLKGIRCIFIVNGKAQEVFSDEQGVAQLNIPHCDTMYVQHPLFPDIVTLIKDKKNDNNRFKLVLNPSLQQVSFKGIDFIIVSDRIITCLPNYLLDITDIEFVKE